MKTVAYLRVSTAKQDLESQKLAILSYAQKEKIQVDAFHEMIISATRRDQRAHFDSLVASLEKGDRLLVSELSRIGRSLGVIITQINTLLERGIDFVSVKEQLQLEDGKQDIPSKMTVAMFGLFAEVERDLISERTKEGLKRAKQAGKKIGRPVGTKGKSKLDGKEQAIAELLDKKVSKSAIAKIMGVSPTTVKHFIKTRQLESGDLLKTIC